jgi:hemerythrin-like metal-binding protein
MIFEEVDIEMEVIPWTPDFLIGVERVDDQHKELFRRLNSLGDALWDGSTEEDLIGHVTFLSEYVKSHFADEEALMSQYEFPGLSAQEAAHRQFIDVVATFEKQIVSGQFSSALAVKIFDQSCSWVKEHVIKMDKTFGQYVQTTQKNV